MTSYYRIFYNEEHMNNEPFWENQRAPPGDCPDGLGLKCKSWINLKCQASLTPSPHINDIPSQGLGSKEPAHVSGEGPGPTTRVPTKDQTTQMQRA